MRVGIFHNYMDNIGGAELVTLILAREFNADIYTTVYNQTYIKKLGFQPRIHSIGWVPRNAPIRQQLTAYHFKKLQLTGYDFFIISGDWAASGGYTNKPNLWIIYSPPRELWDLYEHTRKTHVGFWGKWLFDAWVQYNRKLTNQNILHTTKKVAISKNVQSRVKQFLKLDVPVVYPPTETTAFKYEKNGDFWLSVNRLINHKRIEIQIDAMKRLPHEKLVIVGSYEKSKHFKQYARKMMNQAPSNVIFKSWIDDTELKKLYATCKAFITTSLDEDYGMNVVEAMASGKPVIAPREGGYIETIQDGKTGVLLDQINGKSLADAMSILGKHPHTFKDACIHRAKRFDSSIFITAMREHIQQTLKGYTESEVKK